MEVLIGGLLAQIYINSILFDWSGGSAFGARRFASSALIFAVGLATLLRFLGRRPLVAVGTVLGCLIAGNIFFMTDVRVGTLPSEQGVTVDRIVDSTHSRIGNPFSFPANVLFAWRHRSSPLQYDELGRRLYDNPLIDLGETGDDRFLTHGWPTPERNQSFGYRWGIGRESAMVVSLRRCREYVLEVRVQPFTYSDSPPASMVVEFNGHQVADQTLWPEMERYRIPVATRFTRLNLNEIKFRYSHAVSPRSLGMSDDPRLLAVSFDYVRLESR